MFLRILSEREVQVIEYFLENKDSWVHGYSISKYTDIDSGTLYPILKRFEKYLERQEEGLGRKRIFYKLSKEGLDEFLLRKQEYEDEKEFKDYEESLAMERKSIV